MGKKELEPLFWTAYSWSGWINLSLDNPQAFVDLSYVEIMMQRVLELDDTFFHASVYLFYGSLWGIKPLMLGGNLQKADENFKKNIELTGGNFLLSYIYYAKYYAAKMLDEELFDAQLLKVEQTPVDVLPGYQLLNVIAKKKAGYLEQSKDELF